MTGSGRLLAGTTGGNVVTCSCAGLNYGAHTCGMPLACAPPPVMQAGAAVAPTWVLKPTAIPPCSCFDTVKDGTETSTDCGGSACPGCGAGQPCIVGTDCVSGKCPGGVCASCPDGIKNGKETAVDCGGGACPRCIPGKHCLVADDCTSSVCKAAGCPGITCQAPNCNDGVKNGTETGIDCGGPCQPCPGTCPSVTFGFDVQSSTGGLATGAAWPGGQDTKTTPEGCSVTINRPDRRVDLVCTLAAPFSVASFVGFSKCFGIGGEDNDGCKPLSCPPAGAGSCCATRPSCSSALNGSARALYWVQCDP